LQSKVVSLASNPQPGRPGVFMSSQWQGGPTGTGFPFHRLLRLAGLRWRYSNPPLHGISKKMTFLNRLIWLAEKNNCKLRRLPPPGMWHRVIWWIGTNI
jgi:hypothetical protein